MYGVKIDSAQYKPSSPTPVASAIVLAPREGGNGVGVASVRLRPVVSTVIEVPSANIAAPESIWDNIALPIAIGAIACLCFVCGAFLVYFLVTRKRHDNNSGQNDAGSTEMHSAFGDTDRYAGENWSSSAASPMAPSAGVYDKLVIDASSNGDDYSDVLRSQSGRSITDADDGYGTMPLPQQRQPL